MHGYNLRVGDRITPIIISWGNFDLRASKIHNATFYFLKIIRIINLWSKNICFVHFALTFQRQKDPKITSSKETDVFLYFYTLYATILWSFSIYLCFHKHHKIFDFWKFGKYFFENSKMNFILANSILRIFLKFMKRSTTFNKVNLKVGRTFSETN